jgi:Amt family ammonium transporter|tara:strand:- start:69 stop:1271 length:1203 start_codon:yes stop_codon:yes gene_type:complete
MDTGDTSWILTSTALVLFMTLPGLALFYGGLVNSKNVISVLMHCIVIACLASILWLVIAYSLAFSDGNPLIGGLSNIFLSDVGKDTLSGTIPETLFFMFQMTFAIITPALIIGAYVERIKFSAVLIFSTLWLIIIYAPITHWIWGGGWLAEQNIMDFAGGLVVHLTAGASALVLAVILGRRKNFPDKISAPHNPSMVMIGASMLWVGWFGFNAGSALAADVNAGMAMLVTHISAATASLVWMTIDWIKSGKPTMIGLVTGTIAGLASITPASGFVGPMGALIIGICAGSICYLIVNVVKNTFNIDDSLDVFAVHGVGGIIGTILVAFLAHDSLGGAGYASGMDAISQLVTQLTGVVSVLVWSVVGTIVIALIIKKTTGLRVDSKEEDQGLDISAHGETNQ